MENWIKSLGVTRNLLRFYEFKEYKEFKNWKIQLITNTTEMKRHLIKWK